MTAREGSLDPGSAVRLRRLRFVAAVGAGLLLLGAATGCAGQGEQKTDDPASGTGPAVSDLHDPEEDTQTPSPEERAPGVPDECFEVYPWATGPVSQDDLELLPEGWPAAPDGATACTANTGGGSEKVAYVTGLPIDDVLDHYEATLGGPPVAQLPREGKTLPSGLARSVGWKHGEQE